MKSFKFFLSSVLIFQATQGMESASKPEEENAISEIKLSRRFDTLESILGAGNNLLLKVSMNLQPLKTTTGKEQKETIVSLFLTDFSFCPTNHPVIKLNTKVDCEASLPPTYFFPEKPKFFKSYAQFTDWLDKGYFRNSIKINYDFHVDVHLSLAQHLFYILPGKYHFKGVHEFIAAVKPDKCMPQSTWSSKRGTINATTVTLGATFYLNDLIYPIDDCQQVFPHPIIEEKVLERDETKKFYHHQWLAHSKIITKFTYEEFSNDLIKDWPNPPSGNYSLVNEKFGDLEKIDHILCSNGRTGEEIDIRSVEKPFLIISQESSKEWPWSIETVIKSETGDFYITKYRSLEIKKEIDYKLESLISIDGFINSDHIKYFWLSSSEAEKFTRIKLRGDIKDQDLYNLMVHPTKLKGIDWTQCRGVSLAAQRIVTLCWDRSPIMNLNSLWIGAEGGKAIGQALSTNTTLISLNLNGNKIRAEGAEVIGQALKINTTLTSLNLCGNQIGSKGVMAIWEGLKANTALTSLDLGDNEIDADGIEAIRKGLTINTTLIDLNLNGNYEHSNAEGLRLISDFLIRNRNFKYSY